MTALLLVLVFCSFLPLGEALAFSMLRQTWPEIGLFEPGRTDYKVTHPNIAYALKQESLVEARLTCSNISLYGALAPKIPQSIVTAVNAMKRNRLFQRKKIHNYNFMGVFEHRASDFNQSPDRMRRRGWLKDFAESNMTRNDVLVLNHKDIVGHKDIPLKKYAIPGFDPAYYLTMISSNFTLCPGGDAPWSERFYEAILAESVPVIKSLEDDWLDNGSWIHWCHNLGYEYVTLEQLSKETMSTAEMKRITDHNYELFMKYQTWVYGDQVPPAYTDEYRINMRMPCLSHEGCRARCIDKNYEDLKS